MGQLIMIRLDHADRPPTRRSTTGPWSWEGSGEVLHGIPASSPLEPPGGGPINSLPPLMRPRIHPRPSIRLVSLLVHLGLAAGTRRRMAPCTSGQKVPYLLL